VAVFGSGGVGGEFEGMTLEDEQKAVQSFVTAIETFNAERNAFQKLGFSFRYDFKTDGSKDLELREVSRCLFKKAE
jgi:phytoene/squalene synthetase